MDLIQLTLLNFLGNTIYESLTEDNMIEKILNALGSQIDGLREQLVQLIE